jgi:hypothetical protein
MQIRIGNIVLINVLFLVSNLTFAAKPPQQVIQQMEILARVQAAYQLCFASIEYKKLPATEALRFHDISIKIGEIAEIIEKRYNDDAAYMAIMTAALTISESPEFQSSFLRTYSKKCAPQLLIDSSETIKTVRARINGIVRVK